MPCALTKSRSAGVTPACGERRAHRELQPAALRDRARRCASRRWRCAWPSRRPRRGPARRASRASSTRRGRLAEQQPAAAAVEGPHPLARERAQRVEAAHHEAAEDVVATGHDEIGRARRAAGRRRGRARWRPSARRGHRQHRARARRATRPARAPGRRRARPRRAAGRRRRPARAPAPRRRRARCRRRPRCRSGAASSGARARRSAAAASSSARRAPARARAGGDGGSFLISPPRPTRRSSTGKRSMAEMPSVPASRPDQNASRSAPIGGHDAGSRRATDGLRSAGACTARHRPMQQAP